MPYVTTQLVVTPFVNMKMIVKSGIHVFQC